MNTQSDRLISIREMMNLCGVRSKNTIVKRVESGVLPAPVKLANVPANAPRQWWLSDVLRSLGKELL